MNVIPNMKNYIFKIKIDKYYLIFISKMDLPNDDCSVEGSYSLLPLDVWRLIILQLRINHIKNLFLVTRSFHLLCSEKDLWLNKFKEKGLDIINNNIKNIKQYLDEYKKISYALHISTNLVDMVMDTNHLFIFI